MITSANEFTDLRESNDRNEQFRASHDEADIEVWLAIIEKYPQLKTWVIHNKTIQIEILEILSKDPNPDVRSAVARKRKINENIKRQLSNDENEDVRFALLSNRKLSTDELKVIKIDDSVWLQQKLSERIGSHQSPQKSSPNPTVERIIK